ncbi:hypothetical protein [Streptomyces sp. NPDC027717]|uniref:hypothetical protein n=1 Tax=Streptomyces sp. NPDC027717 TaxID=3155765 RepID=UPI003411D92C
MGDAEHGVVHAIACPESLRCPAAAARPRPPDFRHANEEGGLWYIEAVPDRGELIVLNQAELTAAGQLRRYSWEHLEDQLGGWTDQAIDPAQDPLEAIPAGELQRVWTR